MKRSWSFLSIAALCVLATHPAAAASVIPEPNGQLVRDLTGTIDAATVQRLNDRALAFNRESSVELVALVVPSLNGLSVEEYSLKVLHDWGVGNKAKDNGIVYVWCPNERIQRIEVGYGLEAFIPDIAAAHIIDGVKARVPKDPRGPRLEAMVDAIITRLEAAKRGDVVHELTAATPSAGPPFYKTWQFWVIVFVVVVFILLFIFVVDLGDGGGGGSYGGGGFDGGGSSGGGGGGGGGGFSFGGGDGGGGGASGSD